MKNIQITSGYNFEGYTITEYLGLCSGEAALGTGFLSSLGAGIADILGTNSTMYEEKLNNARNMALDNLIHQAKMCGANAVIAVQIEYTAFSADIMGVTANGTAVKIEKSVASLLNLNKKVEITDYNAEIPIRPIAFSLSCSERQCYARLLSVDVSSNNIHTLKGNIVFTTILDDIYEIKNTYFYDFTKEDNNYRISTFIPIAVPAELIPVLKSASFEITKYKDDLKTCISSNHINPSALLDKSPKQSDSLTLRHDYIYFIKSLNSAKEIYDYSLNFNAEHNDFIPNDLLEAIKSLVSSERMYGNMSKDCIQKIELYFSDNI